MAVKIEFEKRERAIELPDGTVLDIPERTKAINDKVQAVLQNRGTKKEYDFLVEIIEALFGREGLKAVMPDAKNANLDYLTAVYTASVNLFYQDKTDAERAEMQRRADELEPITSKLKVVNPIINKMR